MKRYFVPAVSALTIVLLGACVDEPPKKTGKKPSHSPNNNTVVDTNPPTDVPPSTPPSDTNPKPPTDTHPPTAVQDPPVQRGEIPYAKPVPGKPGFVFSPYDQFKGYIDVRGFPPGTEVKDPYSQKSFLVP